MFQTFEARARECTTCHDKSLPYPSKSLRLVLRILLRCCHIHSAVTTPNPKSAPSSPIATQRPFFEKMEHGHSVPPDIDDVQVWDDSSEEMPTPSVSINGQNTEAKAGPSSTSTAEHVKPLMPTSTWLSWVQLTGLSYRALVLFFLLAFWRSLSPIPSRFGTLHHRTGPTTSVVYLVLHSTGNHRFATISHLASANPKAYGLVPALRRQFSFLASSSDATRKTVIFTGLKGRMDDVTSACAQMQLYRKPRT